MSVLFQVENHIAVVTLNRPEAMNAIDPETAAELREIWGRIADDGSLRCVILTAKGLRAFCTGSDLKKTMPPKEGIAALNFGAKAAPHLLDGMDQVKIPIICAINGYAIGGGLEIALACDVRIAGASGRFGLSEVRIGSIPGGGGTQRLPRIVGLSHAMHLLLTGDVIEAPEALRIGLISKVLPDDQLMDGAMEIAQRIVGNAPLAVNAIKTLVYDGQDMPLDQALKHESFVFAMLRDSEDRIEGRLAFQQKRQAQFQGK